MPKKKQEKNEIKEIKETTKPIKALLARERAIAENTQDANLLYDQGRFGEPIEGKYQYSLVEALFLLEKKKMVVVDENEKKVDFDTFIKKARECEPNFWIRYCAYKDMRSRGYIVKTALKFGADFRVYDRGIKPGEDHAKWILYPIHEGEVMTLYEFSAKNRVAHSTRKRLLLAVVDDEGDCTFYEIKWTRP